MESIFIIFLLIFKVIKCLNIEARDERIYPNGTLVGTYTYADRRGNKVEVNYYADRDSYGMNLKGSKMPEVESKNSKPNSGIINTTMPADKMVPIKIKIPIIDNAYTIENLRNTSNDESKKDLWLASDGKDGPQDYDVFDPIVVTSKPKSYGKGKKRGYNLIRKIRQALDICMGEFPRS